MTGQDAINATHALLKSIKLHSTIPWNVRIIKTFGDRRMAETNHLEHEIVFADEYLRDDAVALDTIRHEVAHVVQDYDGEVHGPAFKRAFNACPVPIIPVTDFSRDHLGPQGEPCLGDGSLFGDWTANGSTFQ